MRPDRRIRGGFSGLGLAHDDRKRRRKRRIMFIMFRRIMFTSEEEDIDVRTDIPLTLIL